MVIKNLQQVLVAFCFLTTIFMTGCQTRTVSDGTATTATAEYRSMAPQMVDVRGSIIRSQYDQGQVMLEVEGLPSQNTRYNRAYVLVEPTTQIVGPRGQSISLSELRQGQDVAISLRGGGRGNLVGMGVARRVWVEERL